MPDLKSLIDVFSFLKVRQKETADYIADCVDYDLDLPNLVDRLNSCSKAISIRTDPKTGKHKIINPSMCGYDLLCPFCANAKSQRLLRKIIPKLRVFSAKHPNLVPAMLTLTVKNGHNLEERFEKLSKSLSNLRMRRGRAKSGGRNKSEFTKIVAAIGAFEFTYSPEHGWHPHVHIICFLDDKIDREELSREWLSITGDSKIIDIRKIKGSDFLKTLGYVLKYALKFSTLPPDKTFEAYKALRNRQKHFYLGDLRTLKVPKEERPWAGLTPEREFDMSLFMFENGRFTLKNAFRQYLRF